MGVVASTKTFDGQVDLIRKGYAKKIDSFIANGRIVDRYILVKYKGNDRYVHHDDFNFIAPDHIQRIAKLAKATIESHAPCYDPNTQKVFATKHGFHLISTDKTEEEATPHSEIGLDTTDYYEAFGGITSDGITHDQQEILDFGRQEIENGDRLEQLLPLKDQKFVRLYRETLERNQNHSHQDIFKEALKNYLIALIEHHRFAGTSREKLSELSHEKFDRSIDRGDKTWLDANQDRLGQQDYALAIFQAFCDGGSTALNLNASHPFNSLVDQVNECWMNAREIDFASLSIVDVPGDLEPKIVTLDDLYQARLEERLALLDIHLETANQTREELKIASLSPHQLDSIDQLRDEITQLDQNIEQLQEEQKRLIALLSIEDILESNAEDCAEFRSKLITYRGTFTVCPTAERIGDDLRSLAGVPTEIEQQTIGTSFPPFLEDKSFPSSTYTPSEEQKYQSLKRDFEEIQNRITAQNQELEALLRKERTDRGKMDAIYVRLQLFKYRTQDDSLQADYQGARETLETFDREFTDEQLCAISSWVPHEKLVDETAMIQDLATFLDKQAKDCVSMRPLPFSLPFHHRFLKAFELHHLDFPCTSDFVRKTWKVDLASQWPISDLTSVTKEESKAYEKWKKEPLKCSYSPFVEVLEMLEDPLKLNGGILPLSQEHRFALKFEIDHLPTTTNAFIPTLIDAFRKRIRILAISHLESDPSIEPTAEDYRRALNGLKRGPLPSGEPGTLAAFISTRPKQTHLPTTPFYHLWQKRLQKALHVVAIETRLSEVEADPTWCLDDLKQMRKALVSEKFPNDPSLSHFKKFLESWTPIGGTPLDRHRLYLSLIDRQLTHSKAGYQEIWEEAKTTIAACPLPEQFPTCSSEQATNILNYLRETQNSILNEELSILTYYVKILDRDDIKNPGLLLVNGLTCLERGIGFNSQWLH
jgi:hypothetical protein